jgi:hypothetical protein
MSELVAHLERQVTSAQKLLGILLAQTEAIKRQDVEALLARLGDVALEMRIRERLERERDGILRATAQQLGVAVDDVDIDAVLVAVPVGDAAHARRLSAELRGLLAEIGHVHTRNRILIRQELAFLDHLLRVLSGTPDGGYSPTGWTKAPQTVNVVDARV